VRRDAVGIGRALGLPDLEPAVLGPGLQPVEEPPRPREPAVRGRRLGADPVLAREVHGQPGGAAGVAAPR
jgi:hypothetical protein